MTNWRTRKTNGKSWSSKVNLDKKSSECQGSKTSRLALADEAKIKQVDEFLGKLDTQDLLLLKQRIQTSLSNTQRSEELSVSESQSQSQKTLHNYEEEWTNLAEVNDYPVALFAEEKGLQKVREELLNKGITPNFIASQLMNIIEFAVMPTYDWGIIDDYKTRLSALNKATKLLGYEKKEPMVIKFEPITQPTHFI